MIFTENLQTLNSLLSTDYLVNGRYDLVVNFNKLNTYSSETTAGIIQLAYQNDVNAGEGDAAITPELLRASELSYPIELDFDLISLGATSGWSTNVKYVQDYVASAIGGAVGTNFYTRTQSDEPNANAAYQLGGDGVNLNAAYTNKFTGVFATTFYGQATEALYADLAEAYVPLEDDLHVGELVSISTVDGPSEVERTKLACDSKCLGVISDNPAYLMNANLVHEGGVKVALVGKVPVKVVGPIKKSDPIISSEVPGAAQAGTPLNSIGWALESNDSEEAKLVKCIIKK